MYNRIKTINLTQIVKILKSKDFGMSEDGGNGEASAKGGYLIIKDDYWIGGSDHERKMIQSWTDPKGHEYKYFFDTYGIKFKLIKSDVAMTGGRIYGKKSDAGVVTLTLEIIK